MMREDPREVRLKRDYNKRQLKEWPFWIAGIRIFSAIIQQTSYVPDEYYQAVDVVHAAVTNQTELTWEWHYPIRSAFWLWPVIFVARVWHLLGIYPFINLRLMLRFYMAAISTFAEVRMMNYSMELFATYEVMSNYLYLSLSSWYNFYAFSRPITNTLESALFAIAISYYKIDTKHANTAYLLVGGIAIAARPTAIVPYVPLYLYQFWTSQVKCELLTRTTLLSIPVLLGLFIFDIMWYRNPAVNTIFNFLKVNIIENVASLYGVHQFGWYTTQGLFVTCGVTYLLGVYGLYKSHHRVAKVYMASFLLTLVVLELGPHKEFRFIQTAIPILTLFAAKAINSIFGKRHHQRVINCIISLNVLAIVYFSLIHQRGPVQLSRYMRRTYCGTDQSFIFVGPCHVLPGEYSRQCIDGSHLNIKQLTCHPPLPVADFMGDFKPSDEVAEFNANPKQFLDDVLHKGYDGIMMFDDEYDEIIQMHGYRAAQRFFHSHFSDQGQFITLWTKISVQ